MPNALPGHLSNPCRDPAKSLLVTQTHTPPKTQDREDCRAPKMHEVAFLVWAPSKAEPEKDRHRQYQLVTWKLIPGSPGRGVRGGQGRGEGSQQKRVFSQQVQKAAQQCATQGERYLSGAESRQFCGSLWRQETLRCS